MPRTPDQQRFDELRKKLRNFMQEHPELLDEVFRYVDPEVRAVALESVKKLEVGQVAVLCDRINYVCRTRMVHGRNSAPRCAGKVIYTEREAYGQVNRIWDTGRGRMRVYHCPQCNGHHLTHTAHYDSDQHVA